MTRRLPAATREQLLAEIREDLAAYPRLHLFTDQELVQVRGTFPVRDVDGRELDSFRVSIELPPNYPEDLPVVREVGGRLAWKKELHVNPENSEAPGTACVLIPDDRWQCFPIGSRFRVYLEGPLHNFFLAQHCVAKGEPWPFGQWDHGERGVYEYYRWLIPTESNEVVRRFLHLLAKLELKAGYECPCGSGKKVKRCCQTKLAKLRAKIPHQVAAASIRRLSDSVSPYRKTRLQRR